MDEEIVEELRSTFKEFDANGDGTISVSEMHEVVEKCDLNLTHNQLEELIETLDKNGDDRIQFEEFLSVMGEKMTSVNRKGDLEKTFKYFDADGSGTIGKTELYEVMKRFKKGITKEQVDHILEQVDSDGSGKISFEEFLKLMNC